MVLFPMVRLLDAIRVNFDQLAAAGKFCPLCRPNPIAQLAAGCWLLSKCYFIIRTHPTTTTTTTSPPRPGDVCVCGQLEKEGEVHSRFHVDVLNSSCSKH